MSEKTKKSMNMSEVGHIYLYLLMSACSQAELKYFYFQRIFCMFHAKLIKGFHC